MNLINIFDIIICLFVLGISAYMLYNVYALRRKIIYQKQLARANNRYLHLVSITNEHVNEEQLQLAKENAELAIRKGTGINNFDKDIRPMLDVVIKSTKRIIESGISDAERRELGLDISRKVKKLSDVVENVLLMARIDSKRIRFSMDKLRVADFVYSLYEEFSSQDGSQYSTKESGGCKLSVIEGRPTLCISVDMVYVAKALREVIKNAFTFSRHGDILLGWFYHLGTDEVEIFVEDNGIGISPESVPYVFDVFYKENNTTGLGIGLSLTKELVEKMGGRITLASRPGLGTRVSILFPLSSEEA